MGDWWVPLILRDLHLGLDRFDELVEDLGISRNLLTTRLAELVEHGVVRRERYQDRPPRDRYLLTDSGAELVPILLALTHWGDRWTPPPGGPPVRFVHSTCGHEFAPIVSCSRCASPITAADVVALAGSGGRVAPGTMRVPERILANEAAHVDRSTRKVPAIAEP